MTQLRGIQTMYAGRQMRSLLEAKWAAFFDELGWRWEYEPNEFSGWIPDFALIGTKQITYVEVKPIVDMDFDICDEIDRSGCVDEVLLLGLFPFPHPSASLGWMRELPGDPNQPTWWQDAHFHRSPNDPRIGFHAADGGWQNRITGTYDGDQGTYFGCSFPGDKAQISTAWNAATNRVQWRSPTPKRPAITLVGKDVERQRQLDAVRCAVEKR